MLDVSVVIVNYNGGSLLRDCVFSLFRQTRGLSFAVTVFDNASTDNSLELIEGDFPSVRIMRGGSNIGFAAANNAAIAAGPRARFFLLLNPDVVLQTNAVQKILAFMESRDDVGICGPRVVLEDGRLDAPCRRSFKTPSTYFYHACGLSRLFPGSRRFGKYYLSYLDEHQGCEVDSVIGAFLMIKRKTLEQIGPLDPDFHIYCEDEDWCVRAKQAGWSVYYQPATTVVHVKGASGGANRLPVIYQWHRSLYLFHKKHLASSCNFLTNLLVYAGIALHMSARMVFGILGRGKKVVSGDGKRGDLFGT